MDVIVTAAGTFLNQLNCHAILLLFSFIISWEEEVEEDAAVRIEHKRAPLGYYHVCDNCAGLDIGKK